MCKSCRSRQEFSKEYLLLSIYLQNLASIQPRTSFSKFANNFPKVRTKIRKNIGRLPLPPVPHEIALWTNKNYETDTLRVTYSSLTSPLKWLEWDLSLLGMPDAFSQMRMLKQQEVLNFDEENYAAARLWAEAPDGEKIPISLVWN